jgi:ABC-type transport system involved in multi-copper enzyme maturation permease subunit
MNRILTIAYISLLEMIRRKDAYVLLILISAMLVGLSSLNIFGLGGLVVYVKEMGLLAIWLVSWFLAAVTAARQIPDEERNKTIFPLLAKPVSRFEFIIGKWLGAFFATLFATVLFYIVLFFFVFIKGSSFHFLLAFQAITLHIWFLALIAALAMLFSTGLNADASITLTMIVSAAAYIVLPRVPDLLFLVDGIQYDGLLILFYLLPHFELFDFRRRMVYDSNQIGWMNWLGIQGYALVFVMLFLFLAWLIYKNKRFSRGSIL